MAGVRGGSPLARVRGEDNAPFSAVHSKKRGAQYDGGCTRRLRPLACVRVSGCCAPRAHLRGGEMVDDKRRGVYKKAAPLGSQVYRLALRLGSSTLSWAQNDRGCTQRLRLFGALASFLRKLAPLRSSACSQTFGLLSDSGLRPSLSASNPLA